MTSIMIQILIITGFGWMFDAMDQGMVSGVIASIGIDPQLVSWPLTKVNLGYLSSVGVLGMIIGAALSGILADRFGRRTIIVMTLLLFSLGSAMCGLSQSYVMLLIFRFITGLGLGGELPVASTLISELSSLKSRGRNVIILESFWAWGWLIAALVAYLLIPVYGWRIAFLVGSVPALFAAALRLLIPESPRYLASRGRYAEADKIIRRMEVKAGIQHSEDDFAEDKLERSKGKQGSSFLDLWKRDNIRSTLVLWILWFGINLGYYGFVLWTPSLLMGQGYTMVKSFQFTLIMCIAQLPGYLVAAILIEKIGRKPALVLFLLGTAVAAWAFGQAAGTTQILFSGCLLYFFALGAWGCIYAYTPELYATRIRGLGVGWAAAFGRVGALIAPMIVPVLYGFFGEGRGFTFVFILLTAVFALVALTILTFGRETKGKVLE
jgi:putative MFS transporter